jgi:hypothetical protein
MPFPVLGSNSAVAGYEIDNSFRFDDASGSFLQRTNGANTGEYNATLSFWFKLGNIKTANNGGTIFCEGNTVGDHVMQLYAQKIYLGSENFNIMFPNLIRDPSAWYHLFVAYDSTQGTAANRVKPYLNGVLLENPTTFTTYPDQNENLNLTKNGTTTRIGGRGNSGDESFDGYLAEFHYLDGTTKAYTDFGEFNDNGVWIPKKYTGGSYGNNGFFLEFKQTGGAADETGLGADTSGEGHHFSGDNVVGATDVTTDTPTNNFCTFNPLDNAVLTLSEGNTKATHSTSSGGEENRGTMGFANGKWYWEFQIGYVVPTSRVQPFGVGLLTNTGRNPLESDLKATEAYTVHWYTDTSNNFVIEKVFNSGTNVTASESYPDNGDIVQFAVDADAGKVWVGKNNTWLDDASGNVGDPANGNYPIHTYTVVEGNFIFPAIVNVGSQGLTILLNTGNPSFAISSGNADANGYGNFEHAPPSGFYSICSKNLAEYG